MKIDHNFSLSSHNLYQFLDLLLLPLRTFINPLLKIRHYFCLENLLPILYLLFVHICKLFNQILADLSINLLVLTFLSYLRVCGKIAKIYSCKIFMLHNFLKRYSLFHLLSVHFVNQICQLCTEQFRRQNQLIFK